MFSRTRLQRDEFYRLVEVLELDTIEWRNKHHPSAEKALAIVLTRLSYPRRLVDMQEWFGCCKNQLSYIINDVTTALAERHSVALNWNSQYLTYERL